MTVATRGSMTLAIDIVGCVGAPLGVSPPGATATLKPRGTPHRSRACSAIRLPTSVRYAGCDARDVMSVTDSMMRCADLNGPRRPGYCGTTGTQRNKLVEPAVKTISVSVDDGTHRLARVRAAETGTTVSAMMRDMLRASRARCCGDQQRQPPPRPSRRDGRGSWAKSSRGSGTKASAWIPASC